MFGLFTGKISGVLSLVFQGISKAVGLIIETVSNVIDTVVETVSTLATPITEQLTQLPVVGVQPMLCWISNQMYWASLLMV